MVFLPMKNHNPQNHWGRKGGGIIRIKTREEKGLRRCEGRK
jgi:hypothetical protein